MLSSRLSDRYNRDWHLEKLGFRSPLETRQEPLMMLAARAEKACPNNRSRYKMTVQSGIATLFHAFDFKLLAEVQHDGRTPSKELRERVSLSSPLSDRDALARPNGISVATSAQPLHCQSGGLKRGSLLLIAC